MNKDINRRNFIAGVLSAITICVTRGANADSKDTAVQSLDSQIENLSSLNPDDLYKLQDNVQAHNSKLQHLLTDQLRSSGTQPEARLYAAFLLGVYRFPEASTALVENITLEDKHPHDTDALWLWRKYPAMDALIRIGNAGLPDVIEEIAQTDDATSLSLLVQVIKSVCRYPECSKAVISHAIDNETKPDRKARLQNALTNFDTLRVYN